MTDERYERSADMRLLELQREALGVPRRIIAATTYSDPEPAEASKDDDAPYVANGAIVVASIDAQPRTGIIAGALVTISLSLSNDGDLPARGVSATLPLPASTAYRPGTMAVDGQPETDARAAELFAGGTMLGDIAPAARRSIVVKLLVEAGAGPIVLVPHVSTAVGAVLGLRAMRLARSSASAAEFAVERPFYEADADELADEAQDTMGAAVEPTVEPAPVPSAPVAPALPPAPHAAVVPAPVAAVPVSAPAVGEPAASAPAAIAVASPPPDVRAKSKPRPNPKTKVKAKSEAPAARVRPEPASKAKVAVVRSIDDAITVAGKGGPILSVTLDPKRVTTLAGLFGGASLGMIAHYLLLNALAVRDVLPTDGADATIATFVADQEQLLTRALITTRLGKHPAPDSLGATLPAFPSALTNHNRRRKLDAPRPGDILLVRSLAPAETTFLRRTLASTTAPPFLRAAQLFVGLCANDIVLPDDRERRQIGVALSAYTALATAEISRIFLRAKMTRVPEIFRPTEPSFDNAARTVLAALSQAVR